LLAQEQSSDLITDLHSPPETLIFDELHCLVELLAPPYSLVGIPKFFESIGKMAIEELSLQKQEFAYSHRELSPA
jgi:hypothetical protein